MLVEPNKLEGLFEETEASIKFNELLEKLGRLAESSPLVESARSVDFQGVFALDEGSATDGRGSANDVKIHVMTRRRNTIIIAFLTV